MDDTPLLSPWVPKNVPLERVGGVFFSGMYVDDIVRMPFECHSDDVIYNVDSTYTPRIPIKRSPTIL